MQYYIVKPSIRKVLDYCLDNCINLMLSYYSDKNIFENKYVTKLVERKEKGLENSLIFMDSGAYTAWTQGVSINLDEYIQFINKYEKYIDHFGQLDTIPSDNTSEHVKEAADATWSNYLEMVEKVNCPQKITYTFHVGEPTENLIEALKWGAKHKDIMKMIALGGMVRKNRQTKESLINRVLAEVSKYYPEVKIHLFGTTSDIYFKKFPIYSGDSSNYIQSTIAKRIHTPFGFVYFGKVKHKRHYDFLTGYTKKRLDEYFKEMDIDVTEIPHSDVASYMANIKYIKRKYYNNREVSYNNSRHNRPLF